MNIFNWRFSNSIRFVLAHHTSSSSVPKRNSSKEVRVRFAPSPTGHMHLGGFRTALYNYLFAKSKEGKFILRIEDTDQSRMVPGAAGELESILGWAGVVPDESPKKGGNYGPYFQSHRLDIYSKYANELLDKGLAYRCFCSEKRLELLKKEASRTKQHNKYDRKCFNLSHREIEDKLSQRMPYTIRFLLTPELQTFDDLIYGPFSHDIFEIEGDPIIIKSDHFPTYHFANVVDDHLMKITHVLRGVEWQCSTPKHLLLYKAFGWVPPVFGHLPLLMNNDGTKLSKRQGDLHLNKLRSDGYYPDAVLNFVTLVGGGFDEKDNTLDQIYCKEELEDKFNIQKVNTASCKIDMDKLDIINRVLIKNMINCEETKCEVIELCREVIAVKANTLGLVIDEVDNETIEKYLVWGQDRITKLIDIVGEDFMFLWAIPSKDNTKISLRKSTIEKIVSIIQRGDAIEQSFMKELKNLSKDENIKFPSLMKDLRILLTGKGDGPPILELIDILGPVTVTKRLSRYIE